MRIMKFWESADNLEKIKFVLNSLAVGSAIVAAVVAARSAIAGAIAATVSAVASACGLIAGRRIGALRPGASLAQLNALSDRVGSFGGHLTIELFWSVDNVTPFGESPYGGGNGPEVTVEGQIKDAWGEPGTALMVLNRTSPYQIQYLNKQHEGRFKCDLEVLAGRYPLGKQVDDLKKLKFLRVLVPLKQYNCNSEQYSISKMIGKLTLIVNGIEIHRDFQNCKPIKPKRIYENSIVLYIDHCFSLVELSELG